MKVPAPRLILTFVSCAAIGAVAFWLFQRQILRQNDGFKKQAFVQNAIPPKLEFEEVLNQSGETKDGFRYFHNLYKSTDGVAVGITIEKLPSRARAKLEVKATLEKATRIIERDFKLGGSGQLVGERVIVILPSVYLGDPRITLLWSDGSSVYRIDSTSLHHILEMERRFTQPPSRYLSTLNDQGVKQVVTSEVMPVQ